MAMSELSAVGKRGDGETVPTVQKGDVMDGLSKTEWERIYCAIGPLDCGHHHCRYCDAGTKNGWQHTPFCPYVESVREAEETRAMIRRRIKQLFE